MDTDFSTALAALRADPADTGALDALARFAANGPAAASEAVRGAVADARRWHQERGDAALCGRLLDLELAWAATAADRARLLVDKATLLFEELLDVAAARACLRDALDAAPDHRPAADLLDAIADQQGSWEAVARNKQAEAEEQGGGPGAAAALLAAAELFLKFAPDRSDGDTLLELGLETDPADARANALMERRLAAGGKAADLYAHARRRAAAATAAADKTAAELLAARLALGLGKADEALEWYQSVLARAPGEGRALEPTVRLLSERGRWQDVAKAYEGAVKAGARGAEEVRFLAALARVTWRELAQVDQAESLFRRVRKAVPSQPDMLAFYRVYHGAKDEIPQLFTVLAQAQKAEADPEAKLRLGIEMAELAEPRPQMVEKGIDAWKDVLRARPGLPAAVAGLRRLYSTAGKWNALLDLLKEEVEALPAAAVDDRVTRLLEMVPIYRDRLHLEAMVLNAYASILALKPDHAETVAILSERYEAQGRWGDLVQLVERQADATPDVELKVKLLHRVAYLWTERLGKPQNAAMALEKALRAAPGDVATREALKQSHTRARNWRALVDVLRGEAPLLEQPRRLAHGIETARLATEKIGDAVLGIALWNEALEIEPGEATVLGALAGLYEQTRRWPALADVLGRQARSGDASGRIALTERRGLLLHEKLGAGRGALDDLTWVHRAAPDNTKVVRALREIHAALGDVAALEALFAEQGAWTELCDALTELADGTRDPAVRTRLLVRVAEVAEGKLGDGERALKAYELVLGAEPRHPGVARAALALYRKGENWGRFLSVCETLLGQGPRAEDGAGAPAGDAAPSAAEQRALVAEAVRVCEDQLGSKSLAFQWCLRGKAWLAEDQDLWNTTLRLGAEAEEWEALSGLIETRLDGEDLAADQRVALLRKGLHVAHVSLARPDMAKRWAERLRAADADDPEAERVLEKIASDTQDWAGLVAVLQRRAARAGDAALKVEWLTRVARIEEEKLGNPRAAAAAIEEALGVEPLHQRALRSLARLREAQGDWPAVAEALRRQIDASAEDERAPLLVALGRIEEDRLAHPALAQAAYLRALDIDAIAVDALGGLERLLDAGQIPRADLGAVCARLARYYELSEAYEKWARTLETLAEVAASDAGRVPHLEMLAHLYAGPLETPARAFHAAMRLFEIDPANFAQRERLLDLAVAADALGGLIAGVRARVERADSLALRCELLAYVAEAETRRGGWSERVEAAYRQVLDIDPLHMGAWRAMARAFRDAERWQELRDLLTFREGKLPEGRDRTELLEQIVDLDEKVLRDHGHAVEALRRLGELQPGEVRHVQALGRNLAASERWRELVEVLAREEQMSPRDAADLRLRRAEVLMARTADTRGALDLLDTHLGVSPADARVRALIDQALARRAERRRAASMLKAISAPAGQWADLGTALQILSEGEKGEALVQALAQIAEVQDKRLDAADQALATWRRILDLDPRSAGALAEVERLGAMLGRWAELADVFEGLARATGGADGPTVANWLGRAADICVVRLDDRKRGVRLWREVLAIDPENAAVVGPAADALARLHESEGDARALVDVLRLRAEATTDREDRLALLLRIASIEEKSAGGVEAAVATYRALLEIEGDQPDALAHLERIFEASQQHPEWVDILRRRLALAPDAGARRSIRFRIAAILEREMGDLGGAVSAVLGILDEVADDRAALDALARLYDKKGSVAERLEILERRLGIASTPAERVERLRDVARHLAGPLDRPGEAFERWREILEIVPRDPEARAELEKTLAEEDGQLQALAARFLEPSYTAEGQWDKLAAALRIVIAREADPLVRTAQRGRLADLLERRLGDAAGAYGVVAAAVPEAVAAPDFPALLDAYERLAAALRPPRSDEVVAFYRAAEADVSRADVQLRMQRTVARAADSAGSGTDVIRYFGKVLEAVPGDLEALIALERAYRQTGADESLLDVVVRHADAVQGRATEELPLRREAARLAASLGRSEDVVVASRRVWGLKPGDADARAALEARYLEEHRWPELADLLEQVLALRPPAEEADRVRMRLARVALDQLREPGRAIDHLRVLLQADVDHAEAVSMIERLLDDADAQLQAADLLEQVYVRRGAWPRLVAIDKLRLERAEDPAARLALTRRIARVYEEQIEDLSESFRWYGDAFKQDPAEREALEPLVRLARRQRAWAELAAILDGYLEGEASNSDQVLAVVRIAAEVHDRELGEPDAARRHYRRIADNHPGQRAAAQPFEEALARWGAWRELRDLLDEQAARAETSLAQVEMLRDSARLSEDRLRDPGRAVDALRAVLDIDPSDQASVAEMERLLGQEKRWSDLRDHLAMMLGREEDGYARDALALKIAELEHARLGDTAAAIERYADVLARTPGHPEALAALEGLLTSGDHRARAAEILEPVYRRGREGERLVRVLAIRAETETDGGARAALWREIAQRHEGAAKLDDALEARARAWLEDVASPEMLGALENAAIRARRFERLSAVLAEGAAQAGDPALRADLHALRAQILESRVGAADQAIEAWREALVERPDRLEAYVALERLLALRSRPRELVEALEKHMEAAADPDERRALGRRVALLHEGTLQDREAAVLAWRAVLDSDPRDGEALVALARLYAASESWRDLADVIERQIESTEDPLVARGLHLDLARLRDDKMADAAEAITQLRRLLDAMPEDPEALELLDRILAREGRHADLLEVLDVRAGAAAHPTDRDGLAYRAARLVEREVQDVPEAIRRYAQILERAPRHGAARDALFELAGGADYGATAAGVLEPILRAERAWEMLAELIALRLGREADRQARRETLAEIARIEEAELGEPARAFATWTRALAEDAGAAETRGALERLAAALGETPRLGAIYEEALLGAADAEVRRVLAVRLAELHEGPLAQPERAVEFWREVAVNHDDEAMALGRLEALYAGLGRSRELADVLGRRAEVETDPSAQARALAALGDLHVRDAQVGSAVEAYQAALAREPSAAAPIAALRGLLASHAEVAKSVLDVLEPLAEARGDFLDLVGLLETRVAAEDDRLARGTQLRRIAELRESRLGDVPRALDAMGRALREDPLSFDVADEIERLARLAGDPAGGGRLLEAVLGTVEGSTFCEMALRAARLFETGPAADGAAERLYQRVLEVEADNAVALEALEGLARRRGDAQVLAELLERRALGEADAGRRAAGFAEAAGIHEQRGDVAAALAAWRSVAETEEGHAEAFGNLTRLLDRERRFGELVLVLEDHSRHLDDIPQRSALFRRIGGLKADALADLDGARAAYRQAAEAAPDDLAALEALAGIEERRGDVRALGEVLEQRLKWAAGTDRARTLWRLADAAARLDDLDRSVMVLRELAEVNPAERTVLAALEERLVALERWNEVVEVLERRAAAEAATGDLDAELAARARAAGMWAGKLGDPEGALAELEKILARRPDHVDSLLALARIHEQAERWTEAEAALDRAAASAAAGRQTAEVHCRMAAVLAARGATAPDIEARYLAALDADPTYQPALEAIEAVARASKNAEQLVQVLELRAEAPGAEAQRRARLEEIAGLYRGALGRPADALPAMQRLVELAPDDLVLGQAHAATLIEAGRLDEGERSLVALLERMERGKHGKTIAEIQRRLGVIAAERGDLAAADQRLGASYQLDPSQPATIAALARLATRQKDADKARRFYRSLLLHTFDEAAVGITKSDVYLALGNLHLEAGEILKARNMFERGLEGDAKNSALRAALAAVPR